MNYKQLNRNIMSSGAFWLVNKAFAKHTNNDTAILMSDLIAKEIYFEDKGQLTDEGFFFNTAENIEADTNIKRDKQKEYLDNLEKLGLIKTCLIGLPRRKHFRVEHQNLSLLMSTIQEKQPLDAPQLVSGNSVSKPTPTAEASISPQAHNNKNESNEIKLRRNSNNNSKTAEILKVKQNYQQVFTGVSMQECDVICDLWNDFATHKVKDADRVGLTMKINTALNIFNLTMDGLIETINNYKEAFLAKNTRSHPHTIGRFLDGAMKNYTPGFYALDNYVWTEKKPSDDIDFNNLLDIG